MTLPAIHALRDLAPAYVMGILTPDELQIFEAGMRDPKTAAELAREVAMQQGALDALAASQSVPAPDTLRARLLARIASEPHGEAQREGTVPALSVRKAPSVTPRAQRSKRSIGRGPAFIGTLATALAASIALSVTLQREVTALKATLASREAQSATLQARLASRDATVRLLTDAGNDLVVVQLAGTGAAGPALQVYWNVKLGRAVVHASGLAPVSANRAYALWMIKDGTPVPLRLFKPTQSGEQLLNDVILPVSAKGVAAFAVTEEPSSGSPAPTMTPFLVGAVAGR
jgi:anti-sigma-K factor RskA